MKQILFTAVLILSTALSYAQNDIKLKPFRIWYNVAIGKEGYTNPDASAILDLGKDTTNKGVLLPKVLLDSVATTKRGLFVYNLLDSTLYHFDGTNVTRYMTYRDTTFIKQLITTYAPQPDLSGIRDSTSAAYDTFSVHWTQIYANYVAIQSRVRFSDSTGWLPTKTFLLNNYFANGGNAWSSAWTVGSTTNQAGRVFVNNANVMDYFSGGNIGIGTGGTNPGYKLSVYGTIYQFHNSAPFLLSNEEGLNSWPTLFISGGKSGGYGGGAVFKAGTSGNVTTTTQFCRMHRNGAIVAGSAGDDNYLQTLGRASFNVLITTAPTSIYSTGYFNASVTAANYNHYSRSNGYKMPVMTMGSVNNLSSLSGNAVGGQISWQYDPELAGFASSIVWDMVNESKVAVEVMRLRSAFGGRLGLRTSLPTSTLHVNGSNGYDQLRLEDSYTPTSSADTNGNIGDVAWDGNYFYVKTAAGWKRSALSSF